MPDRNKKQENEKSFSLEENLRQRDYYEKYYEDLAKHASKMDEIGKSDLAELDREEMEHTSKILGELVAEKRDFDQSQLQTNATERSPGNEQSENAQIGVPEIEQQTQQPITKQDTLLDQEETSEMSDIQEEELIPVDKSHFTEEALQAEARADEQLAKEEVEMGERIKQAEATIDQQELADLSQTPADSIDKQNESGKDSPSEEEDYDYSYGM